MASTCFSFLNLYAICMLCYVICMFESVCSSFRLTVCVTHAAPSLAVERIDKHTMQHSF